jgi:adenylate cyclase
LAALARTELVFEQCGYPVVEYAFKHPLTQEVAYATQLAGRRADLHAAVANALDPHTEEPTAERAMLLAYHWEKAGAAAQAAQWHRRAARALMGSDTHEAIARLRRVLELLGDAPEAPEAIALVLHAHDDLLRVGRMGGIFRAEGERLFAAARALAERSGQRALLTRLVSTFGDFLIFSGALADGQAYMHEANVLARGVEDAAVQLAVTMDNAQTAFWAGRLREGLAHVEEALELLEPGMRGGNDVPVGLWGEAFIISQRGIALTLMGRCREGLADVERSVRLADATGSLEGRCVARQFYCFAAATCGETRSAAAHAHAAIELAVRAANPFIERLAHASLGSLYVTTGRAAEAIPLLQMVISDAGQVAPIGAIEWFLLSQLAEAHRQAGDPVTASALAARAVELARANNAITAECAGQLAFAAAQVQAHGPAVRTTVESALARAASLIDESGAEIFRPLMHTIAGDLARRDGDRDAFRSELGTALALCRERGMDELADRVARELAGVGEGR